MSRLHSSAVRVGSELAHQPSQLDLGIADARGLRGSDFFLRQSWAAGHDAERLEGVPIGGDQRNSRVRPHTGDVRVWPEKRISSGLRNDERLARSHGMLAKRVREGVLSRGRERLGQSALTLEEVPITVHQRNESHRHAENGRRGSRQPVERLLGWGIEERRPSQRVESGLVLYDIDELVVQVKALTQTGSRSHCPRRAQTTRQTGGSSGRHDHQLNIRAAPSVSSWCQNHGSFLDRREGTP
jgi:hypothetical protein